MDMKKEGYLARFYKWSYNTNGLPDNLCPYFWLLVWAVLVFLPLLPATIFIKALGGHGEDMGVKWKLTVCGIFMLITLLGIIIFILPSLYHHPIPLVSILVITVVGVVASRFVFPKVADTLDEVVGIVKEKAKSVKEGYCPRINWK